MRAQAYPRTAGLLLIDRCAICLNPAWARFQFHRAVGLWKLNGVCPGPDPVLELSSAICAQDHLRGCGNPHGAKMADIKISKNHHIDETELRSQLVKLADQIAAQFGIRSDFRDHEVSLSGSAVKQGTVLWTADTVSIELTLNMAGYLLPLEITDARVTQFLLVPYVGACIHAPPPPPNQIVHAKVNQAQGIKRGGLYDPVWVTGKIKAKSMVKDLFLIDGSANIDIGYTMQADHIEPYQQ